MAIEGGVFTNLNKRNGYSFPPFIILTTMSHKLSQNKVLIYTTNKFGEKFGEKFKHIKIGAHQ